MTMTTNKRGRTAKKQALIEAVNALRSSELTGRYCLMAVKSGSVTVKASSQDTPRKMLRDMVNAARHLHTDPVSPDTSGLHVLPLRGSGEVVGYLTVQESGRKQVTPELLAALKAAMSTVARADQERGAEAAQKSRAYLSRVYQEQHLPESMPEAPARGATGSYNSLREATSTRRPSAVPRQNQYDGDCKDLSW